MKPRLKLLPLPCCCNRLQARAVGLSLGLGSLAASGRAHSGGGNSGSDDDVVMLQADQGQQRDYQHQQQPPYAGAPAAAAAGAAAWAAATPAGTAPAANTGWAPAGTCVPPPPLTTASFGAPALTQPQAQPQPAQAPGGGPLAQLFADDSAALAGVAAGLSSLERAVSALRGAVVNGEVGRGERGVLRQHATRMLGDLSSLGSRIRSITDVLHEFK